MIPHHRLLGVPFVLIKLDSDRTDETEVFKAYGFSDLVKCEFYNKGSKRGYAVFFNSPQQLQDLLHIGRDFNQESVTIVDSNRYAITHDLNSGDEDTLGHFVAIPKVEAINRGAFAYVPNMDQHFIIRKV